MKKDIEVYAVDIYKERIKCYWIGEIGFGELNIYKNPQNDGFIVETECLGEEFYKKVLVAMNDYLFKNSKIVE